MPNPFIRAAVVEDAAELLHIYAPYVERTAISFEYAAPSAAEFQHRIETTLQKYPYLVLCSGGEICGYAYTGAFSGRPAYDRAAECTIYLREDKRGQGFGKLLYRALESVSRAQNILNLNACTAFPDVEDEYLTQNSARFHAHMGYTPVGVFHNCGYKFGRWYNILWLEKSIGAHTASPLPVLPFPALAPDLANILQKQEA